MKPYYQDSAVTIYHANCLEIWPELIAQVMVTDPPYGTSFSSSRGGKFTGNKISNDDSVKMRDEVLALWGNKSALVFGSWKVSIPAGTKALLVWDKGTHVGMGDLSIPWKPNHEFIYVIGGGFAGHRGSGVLKFNAPSPNFSEQLHPTEKPVNLMTELLSKCPVGPILDPFMGSGSTLVSAKQLGQSVIGVEISEEYCEIAANRVAQEVLVFC